MDKRMMLKLNGGRAVTGILRGFDPFMNVVLDDTIEECKDNTKNNIGMVVSTYRQKCPQLSWHLLIAFPCHPGYSR